MDTPELSPADIKQKMRDLCQAAAPWQAKYADMALKLAALSEQYHEQTLKAAFPAAEFSERTLAITLDGRESPASLDPKLAQLAEQQIAVKLIVFDRVQFKYLLYL
jgi:hypothetical protein